MKSDIKIWSSNKSVIDGLLKAVDRIQEQEEIIEKLRAKINEKKEILKDELMVDYRNLVESKNRYINLFKQAPFHFTEKELKDYHDFCDNHQSSEEVADENNRRICSYAGEIQSGIIFHYYPEVWESDRIIVECPHCHTKRKLGTFTDILNEIDSPKKAED